MSQKKYSSTILPAKSAGKGVLKIAAKNAEKAAAEIKNKIKAKQQNVKKAVSSKRRNDGKNTVTGNRLKLLCTIVNRSKAEFYLDLIQSFDVNMQCVLLGQGSADKSTLGLLGLTDSDKAVILSVVQEKKESDVLQTLDDKFRSIKGGKGVACTMPLTSVIGVLIYGFLSDNRETVKEDNNGRN